jgi:uncharacterized protein (DUF2235 family)
VSLTTFASYTARSLAGFISDVGIFTKQSMTRFPEAYKYYTELAHDPKLPVDSPEWTAKWKKWRGDQNFELQCDGNNVLIKVIGTWDSVGGLAGPDPFPVKLGKSECRISSECLKQLTIL